MDGVRPLPLVVDREHTLTRDASDAGVMVWQVRPELRIASFGVDTRLDRVVTYCGLVS
jgi:hypothetical protein